MGMILEHNFVELHKPGDLQLINNKWELNPFANYSSNIPKHNFNIVSMLLKVEAKGWINWIKLY